MRSALFRATLWVGQKQPSVQCCWNWLCLVTVLYVATNSMGQQSARTCFLHGWDAEILVNLLISYLWKFKD